MGDNGFMQNGFGLGYAQHHFKKTTAQPINSQTIGRSFIQLKHSPQQHKTNLYFGNNPNKPDDNPKTNASSEETAPPSRWQRFWQRLGINQAPQSDEPYSHIPELFGDFLTTEFMNDDRVMISGEAIVKAFIQHQKKLDGKPAIDPDFFFGKATQYRGLPVNAGEKSAYFELLANQFHFNNKTSQILMFRNLQESGVLAIPEKYVTDDNGDTKIERYAVLTDKAIHLYHEKTLKGRKLEKYKADHADFFNQPDKPSLNNYPPYSEPPEPGSDGHYYGIRGGKTAPGWEKRLGIATAIGLPLLGLGIFANSQSGSNQPAGGQPAPQVQVSSSQPAPSKTSPTVTQKTETAPGNTEAPKAKIAETKPFSNRLMSVDEALQEFKKGRFLQTVTEYPHHNGFSTFVFQEKPTTVKSPVRGNPNATRQVDGAKVYLNDLPQGEIATLQAGLKEASGSIQTLLNSPIENVSGVQNTAQNSSSNGLMMVMVGIMAAGLLMQILQRSGGKNSELLKKQMQLMERQLKKHEEMDKFGETNAEVAEIPDTKLSDVGGNFVAKEELRSVVNKIQRKINGEDIFVPKGILLEGPPGNGKTLMAKALAGEAEIPFYSLSGSELVQMFVGVGASRVRDVFKKAKENSPAIIFIDEIDAIAKSRSSSGHGGNDERESTLNELLRQMDGFEGSEDVFVLAATNRKELLDSALTERPSRFKYSIFIDNPRSDEEREEILAIHQKRAMKKLNVTYPEMMNGLPFLKRMSQITRGMSGDKLQHVMIEAAEIAKSQNEKTVLEKNGLPTKIEPELENGENLESDENKPASLVTEQDCIEAFQKTQYGHLSKVKHSEEARRKVAFHEHGHNIMTYALEKLSPLVISMLSRDKSLGRIILDPSMTEEQLHSQEDMLRRVLLNMGGTAAEQFVYGKRGRTSGNHGDIDTNQKIVVSLIAHGLLDDNYAVDVNRSSLNELSTDEKTQLNNVILNAKKTALTILNEVGLDNLTKMVEESLACDHEMVGEEAAQFNERHLAKHYEIIHSLAESFLDVPEGLSTKPDTVTPASS
jgi:ATP-dependent Zn protease